LARAGYDGSARHTDANASHSTNPSREVGLVVKEGVRDLLLRREQKRFLRDEWPLIRERIKALELDPKDLLK
jgi:hypothetical protein